MAKRIPLGFQLLQTLPGHGRDCQIAQVAWSPDGRLLASCADDNAIILWDVETGEQTRALREHKQPVYSLAWSPDGAVLASGSDDKRIKLWDPQTTRSQRTFEGHSDSVIALAWSPDGKLLASGGYDGTLQLWDPMSGRKGGTLGKDSGGIYGLAWSPDGAMLAAGCYNRDIEIWNIQTRELQELKGIEGSSTFSIAWSASPMENLLSAGFWDGTIKLWDGRSDKGFTGSELHGHRAEVGALGFSHDGKLLVSKSRDDTVKLWHCRTRRILAVLREPISDDWIGGIAFHPKDSSIVATLGMEDSVIRIWRVDVAALLEPNVSRREAVTEVPSAGSVAQPQPSSRTMESISVFVSYSHKDAKHLERLKVFLRPLVRKRNGTLILWDDTMIPAGGLWKSKISEALESAKAAVLLISADFLDSEFISTIELPRLLAQQQEKGLAILPVLLSPCAFKTSGLEQFNALNRNLKTLQQMRAAERAQFWTLLADTIDQQFPAAGP